MTTRKIKIEQERVVYICDFCGEPLTCSGRFPPKDRYDMYYRKCGTCGKAMCTTCWEKQGRHNVGSIMYSYGAGILCGKCYKQYEITYKEIKNLEKRLKILKKRIGN